MRCRRWVLICLLGCLLPLGLDAATGRVVKVLPLYLDQKGRESLSPSLYDRDAYQLYLREHPKKRSGIRYAVEWKAKGPIWEPLKIRVELRGVAEGNLPRQMVLEQTVERGGGWFGNWAKPELAGDQYKLFGEVTAWRVTLWEGDKLLGEEKSFLW